MSVYDEFIHPGSLVFDIGANVGNRTQMFLDRQARRVVAVEPSAGLCTHLRERFKGQPVEVIEAAAGAVKGKAEFMGCTASTLSSCNPAWMDAVKESGRFSDYTWAAPVVVEQTTLDSLIAWNSVPAFIKIDVEGAEMDVLRGLSEPVSGLSFEFTPEYLQPECFEHLERLGMRWFNYSPGESLEFALPAWQPKEVILADLAGRKMPEFGDVYARM